MPLISFDDRIAESIKPIFELSPDVVKVSPFLVVVKGFVRMAFDSIRKGHNQKAYASAASKLGVTTAAIENTILGLARLLTQAASANLTDVDLKGSLANSVPGLSNEQIAVIATFYATAKPFLRDVAKENVSSGIPQYDSMRWKLDIDLGGKMVKNIINPLFVLQIETSTKEQGTTTKNVLNYQTDPITLGEICESLEEALNEIKQSSARRIVRNVK